MTLHCELLLTLAKQTRPVLAHVTPDSRLRSALPPALLAQLLFPMGAASWKSCLHEVPANQSQRRFGTHLHPILLSSGRRVCPEVNSAKLYLDSHLSESDWCRFRAEGDMGAQFNMGAQFQRGFLEHPPAKNYSQESSRNLPCDIGAPSAAGSPCDLRLWRNAPTLDRQVFFSASVN